MENKSTNKKCKLKFKKRKNRGYFFSVNLYKRKLNNIIKNFNSQFQRESEFCGKMDD